MDAPIVWFGGKRRAAHLVWPRFGNISNYVEPFFGSGAMLLNRPGSAATWGMETVNDLDGYVANFWRATTREPDKVAEYADNPVFGNDLTARHIWLVNQGRERVKRLEGDPEYYDCQTAGWWAWGVNCWIGGGFCSGRGPWTSVGGQRVHLGDAGRGVSRQLVYLRGAGQGVNRQRVHLGDAGRGQCEQSRAALIEWFRALRDRLRLVRVECGDWKRICGPSPTSGLCGVFLDPPYGDEANRDMDIYATDSGTVAKEVRQWCVENGQNPGLRICLCGYAGEHDELELAGWSVVAWKACSGYQNQGDGSNRNNERERLWFSPACIELNIAMRLFS